MKTYSDLLSIYDENIMQRQLLHHEIEYLGYQVSFSSSEEDELYENFNAGPRPQLLLVNADGNWRKILPMIERIHSLYSQTKIIIYICNESDAAAFEFTKAGASKVIVSCNIQRLIDSLDDLSPLSMEQTKDEPLSSNPFTALLKNKKYLQILQGLAKSKNEFQISKETGIRPTTVKTYKQRMKERLNCKTTGELVAKAKDYKVI